MLTLFCLVPLTLSTTVHHPGSRQWCYLVSLQVGKGPRCYLGPKGELSPCVASRTQTSKLTLPLQSQNNPTPWQNVEPGTNTKLMAVNVSSHRIVALRPSTTYIAPTAVPLRTCSKNSRESTSETDVSHIGPQRRLTIAAVF